jgi:hypothetical protein
MRADSCAATRRALIAGDPVDAVHLQACAACRAAVAATVAPDRRLGSAPVPSLAALQPRDSARWALPAAAAAAVLLGVALWADRAETRTARAEADRDLVVALAASLSEDDALDDFDDPTELFAEALPGKGAP